MAALRGDISFRYLKQFLFWYNQSHNLFFIWSEDFLVCLSLTLFCLIAIFIPPLPKGGVGYSVLPSVQDIFRRIFLSNCWWQKSDIWSQALYMYTILWVAFLDPSDSYFMFADFVDFYTHWTYMLIFRRIFLSNYWWQKSDIWSQASYRYDLLWEAFFDPSDSYFLFADIVGFYTIPETRCVH